MSTTAHETCLQEFYSSLPKDQLSKINTARSQLCSSTLARFHTVREQRPFGLEELPHVTSLSHSDGVVIVIENIDRGWIAELGVAWEIHPSFFARHARNPEGTSSIWQAIFGNTVAEQKRPSEEHSLAHSYWHVDGFRGYNRYSTSAAEDPVDTNWIPRRLAWDNSYGWQASTRVSCYVRHDLPQPIFFMTDLFLVDAPLHRSRGSAVGKQASTRLHLPLAENRGGLVIPGLHGDHSHSLQEPLQRFSSHYWHLDVLFASGKTCLSPKTFFHLLASSLWEDNLRLLDDDIKRIAFKDIRRPSRLINDQLHDLREALVSLREQVIMTIKWMPSSVQHELESIQQAMASVAQSKDPQVRTYVGYPRVTLQDILERCIVLEHFLMDSFHLLVSSTSVLNAETEMEQANRSQRLTQLAFFIVAVHGIGAHPDNTWCKNVAPDGQDKQYVNWLENEEMLPSIAPQARIMRYGYESQWFGDNKSSTVRLRASTIADQLLHELNFEREDFPHRPLIFVAHCFGGLVVLKALRQALDNQGKWPGVFTSTTGLVFFGTPFRGTEGMKQSEMVQAALSQYSANVQGESLRILGPGDEFLQEVVDKFLETRSRSHPARVACFYETKSSNVGAIVGGVARQKFVVNESSGCLDHTDSVEKYPLARTHFDINKFGKVTEPSYKLEHERIELLSLFGGYDVMDKRQFHNLHEIVLGLSDTPLDQEFHRAPGLIDVVDANGRTPLSWAAFCGRKDYVLSLLCKEAKHDLTDHRGRTALHYAAISGETQCVEMLLSRGADPNLKDQNGMSALAYAVSGRQSEESVNILLRGQADANARDSDNTSILQLASMSSSATVIDDLLQHGSELNHVDDLGQNAATMAVCRNNNTVLSVLLQRGISLDVVTEKGETIMHFAATRATVGTLKTLSTASPENRLGDINLNMGTESQISVNPQCTFDSRLKERRPIDEECLAQLTQAWTELYEVFERQRASLHPKQKIF
ncbi:hypothetical protein KCV03_g10181, partial [Aureobasidium melanogenum]